MLVYLDTNVIMDILLDRFASPSTVGLMKSNHVYLVTDLVDHELDYQGVDASTLFTLLKAVKKLEYHRIDSKDRQLAKSYMHITHRNDALHAAAAVNTGARLLTRNTKDFKDLPVKLIHPDEI